MRLHLREHVYVLEIYMLYITAKGLLGVSRSQLTLSRHAYYQRTPCGDTQGSFALTRDSGSWEDPVKMAKEF